MCADTKTCSKCFSVKPITEFYYHSRTFETKKAKAGYSARCKECDLAAQTDYRVRSAEQIKARKRIKYHESKEDRVYRSINQTMLDNAKRRAKKYNLAIDIDQGWIDAQMANPVCFYLGTPLEIRERKYGSKKGSYDSLPTLDRVDNMKGYTKDNTVICSYKANTIKRNGTVKEIEMILEGIKKVLSRIP